MWIMVKISIMEIYKYCDVYLDFAGANKEFKKDIGKLRVHAYI